MVIPVKLEVIINEILTMKHSEEEWLALEEKAHTYFKELTKEQLDFFADSGAGEALDMVCSGIRYNKK